jgi:single-strand DNA-binding protein
MVAVLNRVILIGRLTRDPELRYTPSGVAVAQFTLAVDRPFANSRGEREADFIPIVVWRQLAETCANYLRKGRLAAVEGRIQVRHYDNNEGRRVYVTEVVADNVRFLESPNREDASSAREEFPPDPFAGGQAGFSGGRPGSGKRDAFDNDPFADAGRPVDISDDDLPF